MKLNIHSIFESISGEAGFISQGSVTTFIRLQGCNLRCTWCDTKDAQVMFSGEVMEIDDIIKSIQTRNVLITGGEPLMQKDVFELIELLEQTGHFVQIETNGSFPWFRPGSEFHGQWVVDYKLPSSGMTTRMLPFSLFAAGLNKSMSMVKFVVDIGEDGKETTDFNAMLSAIYLLLKEGYEGELIVSPLDAKPESLRGLVNMLAIHPIEIRDRMIFSLQIHKLCNLA